MTRSRRVQKRASKAGKPSKSPVVGKAADQPVVTIRAYGDDDTLLEAEVARSAGVRRLAKNWGYLLRARSRWDDDPDLRQDFSRRALADLEKIGISLDLIRQLAPASHIEVELHKWDPSNSETNDIHEAASEVPWEYLLSASTREEGRTNPLLVTRLFRNNTPAKVPPPPKNVLFVESGPGRIGDIYEFDSERVRIRAAVGDAAITFLETPQLSELKTSAGTGGGAYDVIHVTGVDTHQAPQFIEGIYEELKEVPAIWQRITDPSGRIRDGMVLREGNVPELPVNYADLAQALINSRHPPHVVTLNLFHSGARTARDLVRSGAYAALGFLDEIDDESAEAFFQAFYWEWCRPGRRMGVPQAFAEAWATMSDDRLYGTAIVIWMGRSVFESFRISSHRAAQPRGVEEDRPTRLARHAATPIGELLQVEVEIDDEVNYSLLHNDRELLTKLTLNKLVKEPLEDITVQVELNVGAQNYPYRYTHLVLDEPQRALADEVKIPLTGNLPRSLDERVRSTVYVKVTCGGRTAYEDTKRVTLIPVDEWVDDTRDNPWLPSFVLPRDPAILKIINSSRRFLVGITDDPVAGFSGYQAIEPENEDPAAGVDAQVRAIWTALVNEYRLQYINPPPAYSGRTQRLRTPSEILESNTGTCIDLALLLASCLEYIDIYPVMVLLTGHAFVGYWRSDAAHDEDFVSVGRVPAGVAAVGSRVARSAAVPYVDRYGWRLTRLNYSEIMAYVTSGDLVMLEATYLTDGKSFAAAVEEGRANMRNWREFDSLLDVSLARSAARPVTPLPIVNER